MKTGPIRNRQVSCLTEFDFRLFGVNNETTGMSLVQETEVKVIGVAAVLRPVFDWLLRIGHGAKTTGKLGQARNCPLFSTQGEYLYTRSVGMGKKESQTKMNVDIGTKIYRHSTLPYMYIQ